MQSELFSDDREDSGKNFTIADREGMAEGAFLLRGFAKAREAELFEAIQAVAEVAPFRHMVTTRGFKMSVAMTNCGTVGWVSDRKGYRYSPVDPLTDRPWPAIPGVMQELAEAATVEAGFGPFHGEACLINRYEPGAKMGLHQDRDEADHQAPIVSVSLGLPAVFQFGGPTRSAKARRYPLASGDVAVWGGPARLFYHGILSLADGEHPVIGRFRYNLTFRKAL
jgi:DNA oxidative demethylase